MLIHFNDYGMVTWRNECISAEMAQYWCLSPNTVWLEDTTTPDLPEGMDWDDVVLMYSDVNGIYFAYAEDDDSDEFYSDTQLIMQELANIELLILEGGLS